MPNSETTALDDEILAEQAGRDPRAFAALYHRYLEGIYRYLYRRVCSAGEAEEITARVFLDALESLLAGRYRKGTCFAAWLFTIARRRLADNYRERLTTPLNDDAPALATDVRAEVEKRESQSRLARLVAGLDEEKQELLRLRFSAGLSFAAIAELDGRSEAAVKMSLYRALQWLRDHWEDPHD